MSGGNLSNKQARAPHESGDRAYIARVHAAKSRAGLSVRAARAAVSLLAVILMLLLIILPGPTLAGARAGLSLCGQTVIPSLFPFLVLSSFVIGSGLADACARLFEPATRFFFRLPGGAGAAVILGAIGGYPVGAKTVAELYRNGSLKKIEGERLLCVAINSSPAFIVGAVGAGFFGSTQAGLLLYAAHLAASFSIGLLSRGRRSTAALSPVLNHDDTALHKKRMEGGLSAAFVNAVTGSSGSIIAICAFVVLFSALGALLSATGVTQITAQALSCLFPRADPQFFARAVPGILEVTNGCAAAAGGGGLSALLLTAAVLGFSGLSVQFQVLAMIQGTGLSPRLFLLTRLLHAGLSILFAWALFSIFPSAIPDLRANESVAVFATTVTVGFHSAPAVCAMLFLCAILLLSLASV